MRMTVDDFLAWPQKAVTLIGMSGVGKTFLASRLPKTHWFHYSADYRIGTKYLSEPILDNIKQKAMQVGFLRDLLRSDSIYIANNITVTNLEPVSTFLGKLGAEERGGLTLEEFKRRQRLHLHAEGEAMKDVASFIAKARNIYGYEHFLNDVGGSICELTDPEPIRVLTENTIILYLRAGPDLEQELIRRAVTNPKPLYYREDFLDAKLKEYLQREKLDGPLQMDPDKFVRWIFPELLAHRRPLYQDIADRFGYTIDARDVSLVETEGDFIALVAKAIRSAHG